jgi:hypothetical protein
MNSAKDFHLPDYDSLPLAPAGGRSGWGLFGSDDNIGLLNLQTPDRVQKAARLIRKGAVFPLNAPLDVLTHPLFGRGRPKHIWKSIGDIEVDDRLDNFYLQGSSQWDSLGHFGYRPNQFYNGADFNAVTNGERNTVDHWARRGIAGRAVLLDVARVLSDQGQPINPGEAYAVSVAILELARRRANVEYEPGDILLVRTGYLTWYLSLDESRRAVLAEHDDPPSIGLEHSEDMARYVWNSHVSGIAADNTSLEVTPAETDVNRAPFGLLHTVFIGLFGLAVGELWWLEELARDCAEDGVYEMFLTSSPLHLRGGYGSPANAIAIK